MRYFTFGILMLINTISHAGMFANFIGAYPADDKGACTSATVEIKTAPAKELHGVCIPVSVLSNVNNRELIILAVTELKNPQQLNKRMQEELLNRQPTEAYRVVVEESFGEIIKLTDGSVLKKSGHGGIGFTGYRKEAIFYKAHNQWKLCVNNSSITVDLKKPGTIHFSKTPLHGKSVRAIENMAPCK